MKKKGAYGKSWSEFIKERCSGVMSTETETPENRGQIPV